MEKYHYQEGFCRTHVYNGLWPVKYAGEHENYRKIGMCCTCAKDNCNEGCDVLDNAPNVFPSNKEWTLKDELFE